MSTRKQDKNLIPNEQRTPSERRENARKAGRASGVARRQKKTVADYLRKWADGDVSDEAKCKLEKMGLDEDATQKTLLIIPLIDKAENGDLKALQMIIDLLGEDRKREAEIKLLKEEVRALKSKLGDGSGDKVETREHEAENLRVALLDRTISEVDDGGEV